MTDEIVMRKVFQEQHAQQASNDLTRSIADFRNKQLFATICRQIFTSAISSINCWISNSFAFDEGNNG